MKDRFHTFAKTIGWDKFEFSVIEIFDLNMQKEKENYYLQEYLPLLNTIFKSNFNDIQTYDSLYEKLKLLQSDFETNYKGISIYLYKCINGELDNNCIMFNSLNELSNYLNVSRETLKVYLNTYVPYRNNLFLTNKVESKELVEKLVSDATLGIELDRTKAQNIWRYFINGVLVKNIYESKGTVAKLLNVQHRIITNHLDKWIKGGIEGNYLFSHELNNLELEKFKEISSLRKFNNCKVWIYDALTLELLTDKFASMKKAADYFNIDYRSILNNMDTNLSIIKGNKWILIFSHELTESEKNLLINNPQKAINRTVYLKVCKKVKGEYVLLNNNIPYYTSKLEASKQLKISTKTISKYLDTNIDYKELYFFSVI